jgi:predicted nuclease with TOPRIM domain
MKLKRSEVFGLETVFNSLMEIKLEPEVAYKMASNAILANELAEKVRKSYQPVEGYEDIEKLRNDLIADSGGARQPNGAYTIPADKAKEIEVEVEKFNEEHKHVIDEQTAYRKKFDALMDKDTDVAFKTITRKELTGAIEPGKLVLMIKTGILTDGD